MQIPASDHALLNGIGPSRLASARGQGVGKDYRVLAARSGEPYIAAPKDAEPLTIRESAGHLCDSTLCS